MRRFYLDLIFFLTFAFLTACAENKTASAEAVIVPHVKYMGVYRSAAHSPLRAYYEGFDKRGVQREPASAVEFLVPRSLPNPLVADLEVEGPVYNSDAYLVLSNKKIAGLTMESIASARIHFPDQSMADLDITGHVDIWRRGHFDLIHSERGVAHPHIRSGSLGLSEDGSQFLGQFISGLDATSAPPETHLILSPASGKSAIFAFSTLRVMADFFEEQVQRPPPPPGPLLDRARDTCRRLLARIRPVTSQLMIPYQPSFSLQIKGY